MELLATAYTAYTYEQFKRFQRFHARYVRRFFMVALGLVLLSAIPLALGEGASVNLAGMLPAVILMGFFYCSTNAVFYTKKRHAQATAALAGGQTVRFFPDRMELVSHGPSEDTAAAYRYDALHKVFEGKETFYIYTNKAAGLIVDKQGFRTGSPEELRALLAQALPPKKNKLQKQSKAGASGRDMV